MNKMGMKNKRAQDMPQSGMGMLILALIVLVILIAIAIVANIAGFDLFASIKNIVRIGA